MGNHTKFDPVTKPPQALERVISEIEKCATVKNSGFFLPSGFDKLVESADKRFYQVYAHRAGLRKFLVGQRIVLKDDGKFFVDSDRAAVVARACRERVVAASPIPVAQRLAQLKAAKVVSVSAPPRQEEVVAEKPVLPTSVSVQARTDVEATGEPEVTTPLPAILEAAAPTVRAERTPVLPKYVLFLTPIEMDVWTTLCAPAKQVSETETRVAIEDDQEKFFLECASRNLQCTPEKYTETINRFIQAQLIREVSKVISGKRAFKFLVKWEEFHCVEIKKRSISYVDQEYLVLIREMEKDALGILKTQKFSRTQFVVWMAKNYPHINADTARLKLSQYYAERLSEGWGILFRHEPTGLRLLCWNSFEQYEFRAKADLLSQNKEAVVQTSSQEVPTTTSPAMTVPEQSLQKWVVKCHPLHAAVLLKIADGTFSGALMKAMTPSFAVGLRDCGFLHMEGKNKGSKWTVDFSKASEFRFQLKTSTLELSKFESVSSTIISSNQWRKDLEEIAAYVPKSCLPSVVQPVVAPVVSDVVVTPVEPDMVDKPVEEVSIAPVVETQEGVEMKTRFEMSIEDLKAQEVYQQELVDNAVEALKQAQQVFDEYAAGLQQTRLELKDRKRKQREAIEQQMRQLQAQLAELGE